MVLRGFVFQMSNIGNPFVECTSRDMSFKEVFQYWCNPFDCYAIDYHTLTTSATPIIIEGLPWLRKNNDLEVYFIFLPKRTFAFISE